MSHKKYIWYDLVNQVKVLIKPVENLLSEKTRKMTWFNLPGKLNNIYKELSVLKPACAKKVKFLWYNLPNRIKDLEDLITCNPIEINFDVTSSDWGTIVDAESFKALLEDRSGETGIVVEGFSIEGGRLRCRVSNITYVDISTLNITEVNFITISSLQGLYLSGNQIVTFNPTIALPISLRVLNLSGNQIVTFNPTIALPISLRVLNLSGNQIVTFNPTIALPSGLLGLGLSGNQIVTFNPTIALPSGLQTLNLSSNQIVTFNPTIALPSGLQVLELYNNQIVTFNPTIALPSGLRELYLSGNQIVTFNPTIALPISLQTLYLNNNQMTTLGYTQSESWANLQPSFTTLCQVLLSNNINSVSGTNFKTILETKNCNVGV